MSLLSSVLLSVMLIASSFHTTLANGMAIRWLKIAGAELHCGQPDLVELLTGVNLAAYFLPVEQLGLISSHLDIPERVAKDIDARKFYFHLPRSRNTAVSSPLVQRICKLESAGVPTDVTVGNLEDLNDGDLALLAKHGVAMEQLTVSGPLLPAVVDYLNAPKMGPSNLLTGVGLTPSDFQQLIPMTRQPQLPAIILMKSSFDEESAKIIGKLTTNVIFPTDHMGFQGGRIDSSTLDALLKHQVAIGSLNTGELSPRQCRDLVQLSCLYRLQVDTLDAECIAILSALPMLQLEIDLLTEEVASALMLNKVRWVVHAYRTNADFPTLEQLKTSSACIEFTLEDLSQFSMDQKHLLNR